MFAHDQPKCEMQQRQSATTFHAQPTFVRTLSDGLFKCHCTISKKYVSKYTSFWEYIYVQCKNNLYIRSNDGYVKQCEIREFSIFKD